jgi:cobalamin-dependent methionine synthase I
MLMSVLRPCSEAIVFVATLGSGVDRLIANAVTDRMSAAFLLDTIASRLVEAVADSVEKMLTDALPPQEGTTLRYSPGYCDWPIEGQKMVFTVLDAAQIGLSLTEHCLMRPKKSLSGLIGVGPRRSVAEAGNACRFCRRLDCSHRRGVPDAKGANV